ncbi:MAG TPA: 2,4-dihydroxyhept-2-ene-1,7-dioic acid aldolase [Chloroflexi bacterium]|jgi:4-hydroxy-2-oxoheptanedioate aldolase|nr:2,4-dihydroxyhept-2-ene-1,7-dioic acid aldolase [Chloroflexota bacterium]
MPSPVSAEVIASSGFEWVCIDQQHGLLGPEQSVSMLQAIGGMGVPAVVRVRANDPADITKALDAGAQGVIVPMVNSDVDARAAVIACRYPPIGVRSWGPIRANRVVPNYDVEWANTNLICAVMIETEEAVANLDRILTVPGVDAVYVGPADLALSMGRDPNKAATDSIVESAIGHVLDACRRHRVVPGLSCPTIDFAVHWVGRGYLMVCIKNDLGLLREVAVQWLTSIRSAIAEPSQSVASGGPV